MMNNFDLDDAPFLSSREKHTANRREPHLHMGEGCSAKTKCDRGKVLRFNVKIRKPSHLAGPAIEDEDVYTRFRTWTWQGDRNDLQVDQNPSRKSKLRSSIKLIFFNSNLFALLFWVFRPCCRNNVTTSQNNSLKNLHFTITHFIIKDRLSNETELLTTKSEKGRNG